jgi:hypothetical protein
MLSVLSDAVSRMKTDMIDHLDTALARRSGADSDFFHPGEPVGMPLLFVGKHDEVEGFLHLLMACLPVRNHSNVDDVKQWFHRMCALSFRIAPEIFCGKTASEVAKAIGVTRKGFALLLADADRAIVRQRDTRGIPTPTPCTTATAGSV